MRTGLRGRGACLAACALAGALAFASPGSAGEERLAVVTSVHPIASIVRELGRDRVRVDYLVPPGATPHAFEPLPGDVVRLARARLFVRVGGGFDDWAATLTAAAPNRLETLVVMDLDAIDPITGRGAGGRSDPHAWLDPLRVRDAIAPALSRRLAALDPDGRQRYAELERDFAGRLTALDREIRELLTAGEGRGYVAFHNAWRYFAQRYGLVELGVVQEFGGEEPTPGELVALVRAARAASVPAILVEPQLDPRIARTLAAEFGGGTVTVDPLGDPTDPGRDGYEDLMRYNARAFARALGGAR